MQITLEQYERIQNYLDGIMTPQEEKDFLIELDKNISLKKALNLKKISGKTLLLFWIKKIFLTKRMHISKPIKMLEIIIQ